MRRPWIASTSYGILVLGMLMAPALAAAPVPPAAPKPVAKAPAAPKMAPLQATVTESRFLPPAMYGQWAVTGTLADSNVQGFFSPTTRDMWVLEESGNAVTISNPTNGASATIGVDKVDGSTATFHRGVTVDPSHQISEQPTVTVEGDRMQGYTIIQYIATREGKPPRILVARYNLEAERVSGARTRFGNQSPVQDLDFQVEDLKPDPSLPKKKRSALDAYFNPH